MLSAKQICYKIDDHFLLQESTIDFQAGKFHVIMGPNGAGKSTLLKMLAGEIKPASGKITCGGKPLSDYSKMMLAKKRAVLSQHYHISFPITVFEVVMMGRYPFFNSSPTSTDINICKQAMEMMNVSLLHGRDYKTLSGGEAQKVQMSRVLAQIWQEDKEDKILFLDEPVSHLDVKYQQQLLKAAKELCNRQVTVIAILHDINLAICFADRMIFLKEGRVMFQTEQASEVTPALIHEVFDVHSKVISEAQGKPVVVF